MKKYLKKILTVASAALLGVTIASCDANRNATKPTGSLKLSDTYASLATGEKVSYNEMYNLLRNKGYSTFETELKKQLFATEIAAMDYKNDSELAENIDERILSAIYSVTDAEDYKELKAEDIEKKLQQFVDNQLTSTGIDYSSKIDRLRVSVKEETINGRKEYTFNSFNWPEELINNYVYTYATIQHAKDYLDTIKDKEFIKDDNDMDVENQYYLDEDVKKAKYDAIMNYTTTADKLGIKFNGQKDGEDYLNHAIVVKFKSQAQADRYMLDVARILGYSLSKSDITKQEVLQYYITLYNQVYKDDIADASDVTSENSYMYDEATAFSINEDENEYSSKLGSTAVNFIKEKLSDFDDTSEDAKQSYLVEPLNLSGDSNRYMILRINVFEGEEWDELSDANKALLDETLCNLALEGWATETYATTLVTERLHSEEFELNIYDPIYENQYYNAHDDYYEFTDKFDNNLVFDFTYTYPSDAPVYANKVVKGKWTVDAAFEKLDSLYGVDNAVDLLASKFVITKTRLTDEIAKETIEGYEDGIKDSIKNFKKNDSNYSKKMGLENYLVLSYGYDNIEDIVNYKLLASDAKSQFNKFYGNFGDEDNEFVDTGLFANFQKFTENKYDLYYSVDICHMLISVDMDQDGSYEDPKKLLEELNSTNAEKLVKEVLTLANCLYAESELITTDTKVEAFKTLAEKFNNEGYDYVLVNDQYKGLTFSQFKYQYLTFDFEVTAEDLSTIDNSNGKNYVTEFTDEVISLYEKLNGYIAANKENASEGLTLEDIEDNGFWKYNDPTLENDQTYVAGVDVNGTLEQLTQTSYGWHMLYVYDYSEQSSCNFTRADDSKVNSSDDDTAYRTYEHKEISVYLHDTDTSEDDEVVYASGYTDANQTNEDAPSIQQLFIYFMQMTNEGSVTSMRSSVTSAVKAYFQDVMSRYNSSNFQSYRLFMQIGKITFADASKTARYDQKIKMLQRSIDNYEVLVDGEDVFYGWFDCDWTVKGI